VVVGIAVATGVLVLAGMPRLVGGIALLVLAAYVIYRSTAAPRSPM